MYKAIKNKSKTVEAYQLGSDNAVIKELMENGKICDLGDGRYEIHSQEAINGAAGGEIAMEGDWIKVDSKGFPYPNDRDYFEANHKHVEGDTFEQLPKPLLAWDAKLEMCPEVAFLTEKKGLVIDEASSDCRYTAQLWGTTEVASKDAMIVFYSISYDDAGDVVDCDWNFVERSEFDRTYSMI
jgi:hypothetical protein